MLADATPGTALTRSRTRRADATSGGGCGGVLTAAGDDVVVVPAEPVDAAAGASPRGMLIRIDSTELASKPGFSVTRLRTVRIINPAPTSRTTASDTSATTSTLRIRVARRPSLPRDESFTASASLATR